MMRSCRGIFKKTNVIMYHESYMIAFWLSLQMRSSLQAETENLDARSLGTREGSCASKSTSLLLLRTSKYSSADSLRIKTENAGLQFSPFH